ncbi:hypothetical protein WAE61_02010 [Comamonadaceae bacterium PP-2]
MSTKRVHIVAAVNAASISKTGSTYTIRDVCGATDGIVMNGRLYPAEQLAAGAPGLNGKPAPAGHPKNAAGQFISAANGEALATAWIGAYCTNARHEGGRTLVDIVINGEMARATPKGKELVDRLDAAIAGTNTDAIHVSTGLNLVEVVANGESRGKKYTSIATNLQYDHLAILLNEPGAGTPEQGVGMFLNSAGAEAEVETVEIVNTPQDRRFEGALGWVRGLLTNKDVSFDQITSQLQTLLAEGHWIREVFTSYVVWSDRDGKMWRQDYHKAENGSLALVAQPVEVTRQVSYEPVTNQQEIDIVKEQIIAALNAAGVKTEGLTDTQALSAYNSVVKKPVEDELAAEKGKTKKLEDEKKAVENAERDALATELAVNSQLTVDDLKLFPLDRLKAFKVNAAAAPVVVGNSGQKQPADEFSGYDLNKL